MTLEAQSHSSLEVRDIELGLLVAHADNPNEMDDRTFNALCESMEEEGWLEPLQVVPLGDGTFQIVGGHHRKMAAEVLGWSEAPCVVLDAEKFDEDRRKWNLVKLNVLHGDLNPTKFATLWEDLSKRYDKETMKTLMGFTSDDAFRKLYKDVKDALPKEMRDKLDEVSDEIKTIDDLSLVLNRLFRDHGETLPSNMMVFSYGGKEVLWVRASEDLWREVSYIAEAVKDEKKDMSAVLLDRLMQGVEFVEV